MFAIYGNSLNEVGINIGKWYSEKVNKQLYGPFSAIGFLDDIGEIKAVAIFDSYNGSNVNIHIYAPQSITRANIRIVLDYVFNDLKCIRLSAYIPRQNRKLLKILPRLQFVYETILKGYFGKNKENDAVVYKMTNEQASKWIKING